MSKEQQKLRLVIPAGRLLDSVATLLADAGLKVSINGKDYRPVVSDVRFVVKLLKAANIPKLVEYGAHDIGFSGLDWVRETNADVTTVLDTGLLPVRIVAAASRGLDPFAARRDSPLIVASEYEALTRSYMDSRNTPFRYVRTYGATEVFPPEDADMIVDNVSTGRTLEANRLIIIDEILASTTLFFANNAALEQPDKRALIEELQVLLQSVLDARSRVLLDLNVASDRLDAVIRILPAMKSPTVQPLHGQDGFAVRAAVPRSTVNNLLSTLRRAGATDILQSGIQRVIV